MRAAKFERERIEKGFEKRGMWQCEYGYTMIAETKHWDGDGLQWRTLFAVGPDPENISDAFEIYFKPDTTEYDRRMHALQHAEAFMKLRDYYGDTSRR